jgi:competence protein ComEA
MRKSWIVLIGLCACLMGSNAWLGVAAAAQVNINTTDAATMSRELVGIGMKRALAIVEYRQKYGPFKTVDELALVKGIGPVALSKNRDRLLVVTPKPVKPAANLPPALAPKQ